MLSESHTYFLQSCNIVIIFTQLHGKVRAQEGKFEVVDFVLQSILPQGSSSSISLSNTAGQCWTRPDGYNEKGAARRSGLERRGSGTH